MLSDGGCVLAPLLLAAAVSAALLASFSNDWRLLLRWLRDLLTTLFKKSNTSGEDDRLASPSLGGPSPKTRMFESPTNAVKKEKQH